MIIRSTYLYNCFDPSTLKKLVNKIVKAIKESGIEFDGFVFRGLSGILIGVPVAMKLNKPYAVVRKKTESSHSDYLVEGWTPYKYIIIDDFICSGLTIKNILFEVKKESLKHIKPECVGLFLWNKYMYQCVPESEDNSIQGLLKKSKNLSKNLKIKNVVFVYAPKESWKLG
jgi:orotate phosphoribosyltransferase-like protein